jgi:menaquinone-dependent protoporphyrinogen oxidase
MSVIGKILCQGGATVETKWVKNVKDLKNYDAIIIGSAIQYDRWMTEATEFVTANQNILSKLPVAYFFTCLVLSKQTEKAEHKAMVYSNKLYSLVPQVKLVSVGRFAGVLDYSKMSFFFRQIFKVISSITGVPEGDYRDWDTIRSWAKGFHYKLSNEPL